MKDGGRTEHLSSADVRSLLQDVFLRCGALPHVATSMSHSICHAEQVGLADNGLALVPHMVEHIRAGRVNAQADPEILQARPDLVQIDAQCGFACPAIDPYLPELVGRAATRGQATLTIVNSYPLAAPALTVRWIASLGHTGFLQCIGVVRRQTAAGDWSWQCQAHSVSGTPPPGTASDRNSTLTGPVLGMTEPLSFEGPLGGPFCFTHNIVALATRIRNDPQSSSDGFALASDLFDPSSETPDIEIDSLLLEAIINA